MKKLLIIPILLSTLILTGCGSTTPNEAYYEASRNCTITGYQVVQGGNDNYFLCRPIPTREDKFYNCSNNCDQAIDDIRDNVGEQNAANVCLKLCMGE